MNNDFKNILKGLLPEEYDILYEASEAYEKILKKDYTYKLANGEIVKLFFTPGNFHHLIGLQKLTDIAEVSKDKKNVRRIYKEIRNKKIIYETISKSEFLEKMEKRLRNFQDIRDVIYSKAIVDFDKSKVRASKLEGSILLFDELLTENNILSVIKKVNSNGDIKYNPESFLVQKDDYYFKDQIILDVVDFDVKDACIGNKNNKYKRN
jgi:hypothetical protein